jgi:hypothetical protein
MHQVGDIASESYRAHLITNTLDSRIINTMNTTIKYVGKGKAAQGKRVLCLLVVTHAPPSGQSLILNTGVTGVQI